MAHTQSVTRRFALAAGVAGSLSALVAGTGCGRSAAPDRASDSTLRVGVGGMPQQAPQAGLRQFVGSLSIDSLAMPNDDGRLRPSLAESWSTSADGLTMTVRLRPNAKFHDGTRVTGALLAQALTRSLPPALGPVYEDVAGISAADDQTVRFEMRRPSQFIVEALETAIPKPGAATIGTGPYVSPSSTSGSPTILRANSDYYLERPAIEQIAVTSYPTARAAWAELLRGNLDMLYEVGPDALDSLHGASNIAVFSFVRHYQYMIVFGPHVAALASPDVRRELAAALDRDAIVRQALNGHGVPSTGPVQSEHWALNGVSPRPPSKDLAKKLAARHLTFTCLAPPDAVYERLALAVRQQLAAVGVDMKIQEASQEQIVEAAKTGNYEALLADIISGPTMFREYRRWYSKNTTLPKSMSIPKIDAALDQVRHAPSDDAYRAGVRAFQQAVEDDPPALFLAWSERARAISRRFEVPAPDNGRDVLSSIRLWRPAPGVVSTN